MSTTPGDEGRRDRPDMPMGQTLGSPGSIARLPMPGNAEFAVYIIAVIFLAILWIAMDHFEVNGFVLYFTVLTSFYLLSRGIAKASRVLEV